MKRIIVSAICVVMCCIFSCQYVAAVRAEATFEIDSIYFDYYDAVNLSTGVVVTPNVGVYGTFKNGVWEFVTSVWFTQTTVETYKAIGYFDVTGHWIETVTDVEEYMWLNVKVTYDNNHTLNFDKLETNDIRITLPDGTRLTDYFLSKVSDTSYLISFLVPLSNINYDFSQLSSLTMALPIDWEEGLVAGIPTYLTCTLKIDDFTLTYNATAITADEVAAIIDSLDNVETMLDEVTQNQNITVNEIIATREVIEQNGEKLQEISDKQDTIITELEQLPDALRDLEVGDPYEKSLDTSEIAAYESAYEKVMEEVDVDQVVNIMDGGISLNQDGMYNDQSFNSVSGLVMDIIDATGLMPLIMISLTFGLACFIIGRSGNL